MFFQLVPGGFSYLIFFLKKYPLVEGKRSPKLHPGVDFLDIEGSLSCSFFDILPEIKDLGLLKQSHNKARF